MRDPDDFDDNSDEVDPAIWPKLMELLRRLPRDERQDEDEIEPFI